MLPQPMVMELVLTAALLPIERFAEVDFVNLLADTPDAVREQARALAERIRDNAPLSVAAGKRALLDAMSLGCEAGLANADRVCEAVCRSEDAEEGPRALAAKRAPVWKGR